MRRMLSLLGAILAVAIAAPSQAATLNYSGTAVFELGALPAVTFTGSETGVSVSSGGGHFAVAGGVFTTVTQLASSLFTGVPSIDGLTFTISNQSGTFSGGGGGTMPFAGDSKITLLKGFATLTVPLNLVGAGGPVNPVAATASNTLTAKLAGIYITVTNARFTSNTAQITGVTFGTTGGGFVNTVTRTGYDNRTTSHAGRVQMVSPLRVATNVAGVLAAFVTVTLDFVPEPGTLVLLGTGALGLGIIGFRRRRS